MTSIRIGRNWTTGTHQFSKLLSLCDHSEEKPGTDKQQVIWGIYKSIISILDASGVRAHRCGSVSPWPNIRLQAYSHSFKVMTWDLIKGMAAYGMLGQAYGHCMSHLKSSIFNSRYSYMMFWVLYLCSLYHVKAVLPSFPLLD